MSNRLYKGDPVVFNDGGKWRAALVSDILPLNETEKEQGVTEPALNLVIFATGFHVPVSQKLRATYGNKPGQWLYRNEDPSLPENQSKENKKAGSAKEQKPQS